MLIQNYDELFAKTRKEIIDSLIDIERLGPVKMYKTALRLLGNNKNLAEAFMLSRWGGYSLKEVRRVLSKLEYEKSVKDRALN